MRGEGDGIGELKLHGAHLVFLEFDLERIALGDESGVECHIDCLGKRVEQGERGVDSCDFFLKPEDEEIG